MPLLYWTLTSVHKALIMKKPALKSDYFTIAERDISFGYLSVCANTNTTLTTLSNVKTFELLKSQ